jgi:hypothetical protein
MHITQDSGAVMHLISRNPLQQAYTGAVMHLISRNPLLLANSGAVMHFITRNLPNLNIRCTYHAKFMRMK